MWLLLLRRKPGDSDPNEGVSTFAFVIIVLLFIAALYFFGGHRVT